MSMIQKQIEELRRYADEYDPNANDLSGRAVEGTEKVLRNAAETIELLSAKLTASNLNDGWIPITEALPSDKDLVLVSYRIEEESQVDISRYSDKYGFNLSPHVTAWMPLPKPYESGGEVTMGVILSGMEMPKSCGECDLCLPQGKWIDGYQEYRCAYTTDQVAYDKKDVDCPLKSVDGLIDEIKLLPNANTDYWNDNADTVDREDLIDAIRGYCGEEQ